MFKIIQSVLFLLVLGSTIWFAWKKYSEIIRNIRRGKPEKIEGDSGLRLKKTLLLALGQKKMFRNWIPAVLHLFIYIAFIITQIELIEIVIDGISGTHRFFAPWLGAFYGFIISSIEVMSLLALIATFIFLYRRNLLKVPRLVKPEMKGWPTLDANIILYLEAILVLAIFTMNASDLNLQTRGIYIETPAFLISSWLSPLFNGFSTEFLIVVERIAWWAHILVVFFFLNYLPYSKHLHIIFAFPNTWFSDIEPKGKMENMPAITNEIKLMMNPEATDAGGESEAGKFGAEDVTDLSWRHILAAYSCTECGRCTAACPANQTGKLLSPRKIMMNVRDRVEEIARAEKKGETSEANKLLGGYITPEEINACTSCNACVEECPVSINPLNIILELRRFSILEAAQSPEEWNLMFSNTENNGAVWQFNAMDRAKWVEEVS